MQRITRIILLNILICFVQISTANAAEYKMRYLESIPGHTYSGACDINDNGEILGYSARNLLYENYSEAYMWNSTGMQDLGFRFGSSAVKGRINNQRQAITTTNFWDNGQLVSLPTLISSGINRYYGINESGCIAGGSTFTTTGSGTMHACLWENGELNDLGVLPGDITAKASDVNDMGIAVGSSKPTTDDINPLSHAFIWDGSKMSDLGHLDGFSESVGVAINNSGQVVGYSYCNEAYGSAVSIKAFLWQDGTMIDLVSLPYYNIYVLDITDSGKILGYANPFYAPHEYRTFVWENGNITWLDWSGYSWVFGWGINDAGDVVGLVCDKQNYYHAAIWEVVPEPSTFIVLLCGLLAIKARLSAVAAVSSLLTGDLFSRCCRSRRPLIE